MASQPANETEPAAETDLFAAIQSDAPGWQRHAFDRYHGLVYGLLVKALGPTYELEDCVGDVFLSFFEHAKNIREAANVRSYLISITMNIVRREARRRKQRRLLYKLTGADDPFESSPSADDPKAKAALIQLGRILDEMDTEERLAFVLSGLVGMPIADIAHVLNVSHSTAKRRVRRANRNILKRVSRNALLADYIPEKRGSFHE